MHLEGVTCRRPYIPSIGVLGLVSSEAGHYTCNLEYNAFHRYTAYRGIFSRTRYMTNAAKSIAAYAAHSSS